jgi:signal transduction histidine kinase
MEQITEHLRVVLDNILFSGHKALLTSTMHVASIRESYRELTEKNAELSAAYERLKELDRLKSNFLATMSHELRTPMNVIFGMTEMALEMDSPKDQRECLETTRRAAQSLLVLMDDVLDLSRIEAGGLELHPQPFSVRQWLDESIEPLRVFARSKNVSLDCEVAPDVHDLANGDPDRLRQVLVNLVGNALKYTDAGEVRVRVDAAAGRTACEELHFTVSDTGIGISPEQQKRIFDAYVQAETNGAPPRGGTGLGLAICSRLVDLMGGRIWVESDLGKGSRFHFTAAFESSQSPRGST